MLNVLLIGYGELASSMLLGIIEAGHNPVGVVRWNRIQYSTLRLKIMDFFNLDPFYSLIRSYKVKEIKVKSVNSEEFVKQALKLQPDVILIGSWGEILKKHVIVLPKIACVNCHPSLLPKHRGSNPYFSTIRHGETHSGITFHLVDEKIDTGPILLQKAIKISQDDTGKSLRTKCAYEAKSAVKELLEGLENGVMIPLVQNEEEASYYPRINESDVIISWNETANEIHNRIRALYPWTCSYTRHNNKYLKVVSSKIVDIDPENSEVELVKGKIIRIRYTGEEEAGTILAKYRNNLLVVTKDRNKAILLGNVSVFGVIEGLFGRLYIDFCIKEGDVLLEI